MANEVSNLQNMRKFYLTYPEFDTQCVANLSWTNVRTIIRIDDKQEHDYHQKESVAENWTSRQLERNIKSGYYHRLLSTQEKSTDTNKCLPATIDTKEFIKDPYVLEFLNS